MADAEKYAEEIQSGSPASPVNSSLEKEVAGDADRAIVPGELSCVEVTAGGMGRHLGVTSATFLM